MANWHYQLGTETCGPVDEAAFAQLVRQGTIQANTLVWQTGWTDWKPYGQVDGATPVSAPARPSKEFSPADIQKQKRNGNRSHV